MTPLEQMYPARCFDCLQPTGDPDKVLCAHCEAMYSAERVRRRNQALGPESTETP